MFFSSMLIKEKSTDIYVMLLLHIFFDDLIQKVTSFCISHALLNALYRQERDDWKSLWIKQDFPTRLVVWLLATSNVMEE